MTAFEIKLMVRVWNPCKRRSPLIIGISIFTLIFILIPSIAVENSFTNELDDIIQIKTNQVDTKLNVTDYKMPPNKITLDINFTDTISSEISWSPDGSKIAFGTSIGWKTNKSIIIWNVNLDTLVLNITTDYFYTDIKRVVWSPDGTKIAAGSDDGGSTYDSTTIWDANTGALMLEHPVILNSGDIHSLDWSPDSTLLAIGKDLFLDGQHSDIVIVIDDIGKEKYRITSHTTDITSVRFGSDGSTILSGSRDGTIVISDTETGSQITMLNHPFFLRGLEGHPQDDILISSSSRENSFDASLRIWDLGQKAYYTQLIGFFGDFRVSPDGRVIVFYNLENTTIHNIVTNETEYSNSDIVGKYVWNPNGTILSVQHHQYLTLLQFNHQVEIEENNVMISLPSDSLITIEEPIISSITKISSNQTIVTTKTSDIPITDPSTTQTDIHSTTPSRSSETSESAVIPFKVILALMTIIYLPRARRFNFNN